MDMAKETPETKEEYKTHSYYMGLALEEAQKALEEEEVPVGAILVQGTEIIATAHNETENQKSPLAHAEMLILQSACRSLNKWRLSGCTLYVTLEPCSMCAGAMVLARIQKLVFALPVAKSGACGSIFNIVEDPRLNHRIQVVQGIREEEARQLMRSFFQKKRDKKLQKKHKSERCQSG